MPTQEELLQALKAVKYPGFSRDIVAFGIVKGVEVGAAGVTVKIAPSTDNDQVITEIRRAVVETLSGLVSVPVEVMIQRPAAPTKTSATPPIPGVDRVVAVASGKGGVGKSTVSVNLALALAAIGQRVGVMDADVYGPSIPHMLGITDRPRSTPDKRLAPVTRYDVKVMSMGFLVGEGQAIIWRGPMIDKLLTQFVRNVDWGALDILIVDLPPGTGDAQLTVVQKVPLSGGVIVTTPQEVALADVRRGVQMFAEVHVPVLGVIENMSYHVCRHCGHRADIFSHGGGARLAEQLGVPVLGEVPLVRELREGGDRGVPLLIADPTHPQARGFLDTAERLLARLTAQADGVHAG